MRSFNTQAVVLKNINYQDADKIYTLLSKEKGKISAIAKGVRKVTSRRSGNLDTLNHVIVKISEHKSGLNYLQEVKALSTFKKVKNNRELSNKAFYLVELINRTVREDEDAQDIYELLVKALHRLEDKKEEPLILVNKFEVKLMQLLGYEPPKKLLGLWRENAVSKDFKRADKYIKNFVMEMLEEKMKSLELE